MTVASADTARIYALGSAWSTAELAGDVDALERLLTPDFEAVGPSGYVLDRAGWLARHHDGGLSYLSFEWTPSPARLYGRTAVVIGLQTARARIGDEAIGGRYRATLIVVETDDAGWRVAGLQLSELPDGV